MQEERKNSARSIFSEVATRRVMGRFETAQLESEREDASSKLLDEIEISLQIHSSSPVVLRQSRSIRYPCQTQNPRRCSRKKRESSNASFFLARTLRSGNTRAAISGGNPKDHVQSHRGSCNQAWVAWKGAKVKTMGFEPMPFLTSE